MIPLTYKRTALKFIFLVNYYCNTWERLSHILAPLTKLISNKIKFKWNEVGKKCSNKLIGLWPTIFY